MQKYNLSFFESGIFPALKAESFLLVRNCVLCGYLKHTHTDSLLRHSQWGKNSALLTQNFIKQKQCSILLHGNTVRCCLNLCFVQRN